MRGRHRHHWPKQKSNSFSKERRSILKGFAGSAFVTASSEVMNTTIAGVVVGALVRWNILREHDTPEAVHAIGNNDPFAERRMEALNASPLFRERIKKFRDEFTSGPFSRLDETLSRQHGRHPTVGDSEHRSRIDYVREELMRGVSDEQLPRHVREELPILWVGLPAQEAEYDNSAISRRNGRIVARHLGQVTEGTRRLYGYDEHEIRYHSNQVELMRRMCIDAYNIMYAQIGPELRDIERDYFAGNEEHFQREFLTLAIINSYQTGVGNMITVIRKFAHSPRRRLRRYDVFTAMALAASDGSFDRGYQEESSEYPFRVYAASLLINARDTSARD